MPAIVFDETQRVGLHFVLRRRIGAADGADVDEGDRNGFGAGRHCQAFTHGGEAELEGEVFGAVAVVVDMDLVQGFGIHREEVGAACRILQRNVVGDQRHIGGATGLVAAKHVEVGRVNLRQVGDERRLPMTGSQDCAGYGQRRCQGTECHGNGRDQSSSLLHRNASPETG